ncbi:hypothetical protein Bca52824_017426 [Brassica carinata]|uniref:Uncharacterized protein n=1 Tax=Brassica carinata TaxID=52824 RepID=A0A8X8AVD2_BRACI|nr:hypothetical protein Bca52824_017426 [Brassica carinata]
MAGQVLPNLPDKIMCKIIELVGEDSFYYLGGFLRAGKRGYALAHEPSVLKMCDVTPMVSFATCQIGNGGQFREFLPKCVNAGNTNAIYYEGLHAATIIGVEESIKISEPNVPMHRLSTLDVGIFNVCLGKDKEASKVIQQFAAYHADLRSDAILKWEMR